MQIRMATPADAAAIAGIYAPIVTSTIISFEEIAPTVDEMRGRIEKILPKYPWLVAEEGGIVAGYAYGSPHSDRAGYRWSANASVYIDERYRRKGVGRALYTRLFELLAAQGYQGAYAGITLPNPGSIGLHESFGFELVGVYRLVGYKMGAWYDVGWWRLGLGGFDDHPVEPKPLDELAIV